MIYNLEIKDNNLYVKISKKEIIKSINLNNILLNFDRNNRLIDIQINNINNIDYNNWLIFNYRKFIPEKILSELDFFIKRIIDFREYKNENLEFFDPKERAKEKQISRDQDAEDLRSGKKSRDDLRRENGMLFGAKFIIDLSQLDKKLYIKLAPLKNVVKL